MATYGEDEQEVWLMQGSVEDEVYQRLSDNIYDAVSKFEMSRRQAYLRINSTPPAEQAAHTSRVSLRSGRLLYVGLLTDCEECAHSYARLPLDQYLMWFMRIPYECEHRMPVTNMMIEGDEEEASRVAGTTHLPHEYRPLKPPNASESSVGEVTASSLEGHIARLERDAETAEHLITTARLFLEGRPANVGVFPQLDRELLLNKGAYI